MLLNTINSYEEFSPQFTRVEKYETSINFSSIHISWLMNMEIEVLQNHQPFNVGYSYETRVL